MPSRRRQPVAKPEALSFGLSTAARAHLVDRRREAAVAQACGSIDAGILNKATSVNSLSAIVSGLSEAAARHFLAQWLQPPGLRCGAR
jgi:hypothetical protein